MKKKQFKLPTFKDKHGMAYARFEDLPKDEVIAFYKFLSGQTMPLVEEEKNPYGCFYPWDYDNWKASLKGKQLFFD